MKLKLRLHIFEFEKDKVAPLQIDILELLFAEKYKPLIGKH